MIINYLAELGIKMSWQEYAALPGADNIFVDNSKPNRGLNKKASNYSGKQDYELYIAMEAVVSQDGVPTTYRAITPICKSNDFDVPTVDPRDFEVTIQLFTLTGDEVTGTAPTDRKVIMRATHTLVNGGDIGDYADAVAVHRIEPKVNAGNQIYEYSSVRPNMANIPLTDPSGFTTVQYQGNSIITECQIDGEKLIPGVDYRISSRLFMPNVEYIAPTASITNIVPDQEAGSTNWDLTLTAGTGTLEADDTVEIKVYNNATDILLETLTGNFTNAFSALASDNPSTSIKGYMTGSISSSITLTFDKLAWATAQALINEAAIAIRLELVLTKTDTGLQSNTATGIFTVELQEAEYQGDLRYFDTDNRKLYSTHNQVTNANAVGIDLTLRYSQELFPIQNGTSLTFARVNGDSDFGTPWSKLLICEDDIGNSPFQWISEANTIDGETWSFDPMITNVAGANHVANHITKDSVRVANGRPVYWLGFDLVAPQGLYMLYYNGSAWQAVDFSSLTSPLFPTAIQRRTSPQICSGGDVLGLACKNGIGGEKRIFRLRQTSGSDAVLGDFSNPANWTVKVMAGSTTSGTADGTGAAAQFRNPTQMWPVGGNIWVTDGEACTVRLLVHNGGSDEYDVTTILGTADTPGDLDGTGVNARFDDVRGLTVSGSFAYIGDCNNHKIRKVNTSSLVVTTFSGTGDNAYRLATLY